MIFLILSAPITISLVIGISIYLIFKKRYRLLLHACTDGVIGFASGTIIGIIFVTSGVPSSEVVYGLVAVPAGIAIGLIFALGRFLFGLSRGRAQVIPS